MLNNGSILPNNKGETKMKQKEIERRWILQSIPKDLYRTSEYLCHQSYLFAGEEEELRIRAKYKGESAGFRLTHKSGGCGKLSRDELETPICEAMYKSLLTMALANNTIEPITKQSVEAIVQGTEIVFSIVDQAKPTEYNYCEVEFTSKNDAEAYVLPLVNAIEVTDDTYYNMASYWRCSRLGVEMSPRIIVPWLN